MKQRYLKILTGPDKGSVYEVSGNRVRIGRDDDNDIIVSKDARCSRQHAYFRLSGPQNEIFNLGKNIILINGKKGKHFVLQGGDIIQLGKTQIQFETENPLRDAKAFNEAAQAEAAQAEETKTQDRLFYELEAQKNETENTKTCVTLLRAPAHKAQASKSKKTKDHRNRNHSEFLKPVARQNNPATTAVQNPSVGLPVVGQPGASAPAAVQKPSIGQFKSTQAIPSPIAKPPMASSPVTAPAPAPAPVMASSSITDQPFVMPQPLTPPGGSNKKRPFIYLGVAGLVMWFLFSGDNKKKTQELRQPAQVNQDIEQTQQQIEERKKQDHKKRTEQYKKAQAAFIEGRRAYQQGQYERAHISFIACLNLYPKHTLCLRYQNLAHKKKNELVQYHMIKGRHFKQKNQFRQCAAAFKQVMNMQKNTTSLVYKEAQVNFEACNQKIEDQY